MIVEIVLGDSGDTTHVMVRDTSKVICTVYILQCTLYSRNNKFCPENLQYQLI